MPHDERFLIGLRADPPSFVLNVPAGVRPEGGTYFMPVEPVGAQLLALALLQLTGGELLPEVIQALEKSAGENAERDRAFLQSMGVKL